MPSADRHGRAARADNDLRRRPADGFRSRSQDRFTVLVRRAMAEVRPDVARHLVDASLRVEAVPTAAVLAGTEATRALPVAVYEPRTADRGPRLTVFRRAAELRAGTRGQLQHGVRTAIEAAVDTALGRGHR